jgi:putative FmdB family regulatory protein
VPTYEYACTECGDRLEVVQRFSDDPLSVCGVCGGRLRKVFSPVGIVFKGSGFYRTDSRSGGSVSSANGKDSADGGGPDGKADAGAKSGKSGADGGSTSGESGSASSAESSSSKAKGASANGSGKSAGSSSSSSSGTGSKVA